jgi:hypothetical protein
MPGENYTEGAEIMEVVGILQAVAALLKAKAADLIQQPELGPAEQAIRQGEVVRLRSVIALLGQEVVELQAHLEQLVRKDPPDPLEHLEHLVHPEHLEPLARLEQVAKHMTTTATGTTQDTPILPIPDRGKGTTEQGTTAMARGHGDT